MNQLAQQRWLHCNGDLVSKDLYQALYDAIGPACGSDGDNFYLPDLRGRFLRGVDYGSGHDPNVQDRKSQNPAYGGNTGQTSDTVSSLQDDDHKAHDHTYSGAFNDIGKVTPATDGSVFLVDVATNTNTSSYGDPNVNLEYRPKNVYVYFLIYAGPVSVPDSSLPLDSDEED